MSNSITLSIITVTYDVEGVIEKCLFRIGTSKDKYKKEIIVVNNSSTDNTVCVIKEKFPEVTLIENKKNIGFARANNLAYSKIRGKYILALNPDAFVEENTIRKTIDFMEKNPHCGILGCRLVNEAGILQPSARYFPTPYKLFLSYSGIGHRFPDVRFLRGVDNMNWDHKTTREVDWVPGSFFLVRKAMIEEIGFFDDRYYLYYEEIDLCLRAKNKGWKVIFFPGATVVHLGGESAKKIGEITPAGRQIETLKLQSEFIYFRKNYGICYVWLDVFFLFLFDIIEILKRLILRKKHIAIPQKIAHMKIICSNIIATRFGSKWKKI